MIIEPSGNGFHAIFKGPSGQVYCGFGETRQEAYSYCAQLVFQQHPVHATKIADTAMARVPGVKEP